MRVALAWVTESKQWWPHNPQHASVKTQFVICVNSDVFMSLIYFHLYKYTCSFSFNKHHQSYLEESQIYNTHISLYNVYQCFQFFPTDVIFIFLHFVKFIDNFCYLYIKQYVNKTASKVAKNKMQCEVTS